MADLNPGDKKEAEDHKSGKIPSQNVRLKKAGDLESRRYEKRAKWSTSFIFTSGQTLKDKRNTRAEHITFSVHSLEITEFFSHSDFT